MAKQLLSAQMKYVIFSETYHRMTDPKTGRKAFSLLEAAIQCFARKGFQNVTLEMIAREAAVTRPLLKHYFEDLSDIQTLSVKYIRLLFQKVAIDSMMKGKTPAEMLALYVEGCFSWVDNMTVHSRVWLSYMHLCAAMEVPRTLNTAAVNAGHQRIQALLEAGAKADLFHFENSLVTAKCVQTLITGALISYVSENLTDGKGYCQSIQKAALLLTGYKGTSDL